MKIKYIWSEVNAQVRSLAQWFHSTWRRLSDISSRSAYNHLLTSLEIYFYTMTQNEFWIAQLSLLESDAQSPFFFQFTSYTNLNLLLSFPQAICRCQPSNCTCGCASVVLKTVTFIYCHFTWQVLNGGLFYTPLPPSWTLTEV